MNRGRGLFLAAVPLLFVQSAAVRAAGPTPWDGVWTGQFNKQRSVALTISGGKVVSYVVAGTPIAFDYSRVTPTNISFGDRDHYAVKIERLSDTTAAETAHGRHGYGKFTLIRR